MPRKDKSLPALEESIFMNWKRSMETPNPVIAPVAKIVYSKNIRPLKATRRPNMMPNRPRISGLLTKYLEKLVTEISEQALG